MQVEIDGAQISYNDFGQGPAVLLIHDHLLDRQMWGQQIEPLVSAGFRVVLTVLRDGKKNDQIEGAVELKTRSRDIIGLLNYLGIGRAVVCELSFSGSVLCDLLKNYPQRIAGACLATDHSIQIPQSKTRITTLKTFGHQCDETLLPLPTSSECNPITHQKIPADIARPLQASGRTTKYGGDRLINKENVQEFVSQLLEFLMRLVPQKKRNNLSAAA
jgi:pimeloyl-ACP methyl ester carboxylesterase